MHIGSWMSLVYLWQMACIFIWCRQTNGHIVLLSSFGCCSFLASGFPFCRSPSNKRTCICGCLVDFWLMAWLCAHGLLLLCIFLSGLVSCLACILGLGRCLAYGFYICRRLAWQWMLFLITFCYCKYAWVYRESLLSSTERSKEAFQQSWNIGLRPSF